MPSTVDRSEAIAQELRARKARALATWRQMVADAAGGRKVDLAQLEQTANALGIDAPKEFARDTKAYEAYVESGEQADISDKERQRISREYPDLRKRLTEAQQLFGQLRTQVAAAEGLLAAPNYARAQQFDAARASPRMFSEILLEKKLLAGQAVRASEALELALTGTPEGDVADADWLVDGDDD